MKNVNELVHAVREEGTEGLAFVELFNVINVETIEPKAESFSRQLKGDVATAISEGYELLLELIEKWNGTGSFHSLYKTSFTNRLKNAVKAMNADIRSHNTSYDVSLSEPISSQNDDGGDMTMYDRIYDSSLYTEFDITEEKENAVDTMLAGFKETNPEQAGLIEVMLTFSDDTKKSVKTKAFSEYYGAQEYTGVIQRRVSRAKNEFKKYLERNLWDGVLV